MKLDEGYDLVTGWKFPRHDPFSKTFPSHIFNGMVNRLIGLHLFATETHLVVISEESGATCRPVPLQVYRLHRPDAMRIFIHRSKHCFPVAEV
jgi:hypothetical protein